MISPAKIETPRARPCDPAILASIAGPNWYQSIHIFIKVHLQGSRRPFALKWRPAQVSGSPDRRGRKSAMSPNAIAPFTGHLKPNALR